MEPTENRFAWTMAGLMAGVAILWMLATFYSPARAAEFKPFPKPSNPNPFANCPPQPPFPKHREFPVLGDLPVPKIFPDLIQLTPIERLGKLLVFDTTLSDPPGQACATCHLLTTGFSGPSSENNIRFGGVMPGAVKGKFGKRKVPHLGYRAAFSPQGAFQFVNDEGEDSVGGGIMWDERFRDMMDLGASVDPNEMANVSTSSPLLRQGFSKLIAKKLEKRPYSRLFIEVFGHFAHGPANVTGMGDYHSGGEEITFINFLKACQAYCTSPEVCSFSSKFDSVQLGLTTFTASEQRGKDLFFGKAQCFQCHSSDDIQFPLTSGRGRQTMKGNIFTGLISLNTGIPRSHRDPALRTNAAFIDPGLEGNAFKGEDGTDFTADVKFKGRFLVPTLRDFARVPHKEFAKSAMHNGFFVGTIDDLLRQVLHFYNERNLAVASHCGPSGNFAKVVFDLRDGPPKGFKAQFHPPENIENVVNVVGKSPADAVAGDVSANGQVGNLQLSRGEIDDVIAFLKTLVDGFIAPQAP